MKWKLALAALAVAWLVWAQAADFKVGERVKPGSTAATSTAAKEIDWEALIPADWDPVARFRALDLDQLSDEDPRVMAALEQLRAELDRAPVVEKLAGAHVKIPGFVVPLDATKAGVTEFLLVPYFGACIHVPPPPANQIIHVFPDKPVPEKIAVEPVWVRGKLETTRSTTEYGAAGYRIRAALIDAYGR
jgi:hypothetical protein